MLILQRTYQRNLRSCFVRRRRRIRIIQDRLVRFLFLLDNLNLGFRDLRICRRRANYYVAWHCFILKLRPNDSSHLQPHPGYLPITGLRIPR